MMPLAGGNLGFQLTLFQPEGGGADCAHCITACPPGFENLTTSLHHNRNPDFHHRILKKDPKINEWLAYAMI